MDNLTSRDAVTAGLRLPLTQFQSKPRFRALLTALLNEVQALDDAVVESVPARYLWNATGWALEQIGELVGMPRPAYGDAANDDNIYRILIYGQIAANTSSGTTPDLYNILRSLQLTEVRLYDRYPAAIVVNYIGTELSETYDLVRPILVRATHPVQFDITQHTATPFGFAGDNASYGLGVGQLGEAE